MMNEKIEEAKRNWVAGEHHNGLCRLARVYKNCGVSEAETVADMQQLYSMNETPDKHEEHMNEVVEAVGKVYGDGEDNVGQYQPRTRRRGNSVNNDDYIEERRKWLADNDCETGLLAEVRRQDVRDDRVSCKTVVKSLFRYATGHIWHGASESAMYEQNWIDPNKLDTLPVGSNFISVATFGEKLYQRRSDDNNFITEEGVYARNDGNVDKVACLVMELDMPMGRRKDESFSTEQLKELPLEDRKAYRDEILKGTCLILEKAGIRPTAITFSGGKSYHVLVRLSTPADKDLWNQCKMRLKSAYPRIGADSQMLTFSRCTRMPRGCTREQAMQGECQRLVYFDDKAEMELSDITDSLCQLADGISEVKERGITLPMVRKETQDGKFKLEYSHLCWWRFLDDIGLRLVRWDNEHRLMITNDNGISQWLTPQTAFDKEIDIIKGCDMLIAAEFADKRSSSLLNSNLSKYAKGEIVYNPPRDTDKIVRVPFRNGLLEITKDGAVLNDGYLGYDVMDDTPTVTRDWKFSNEKSEFQTFIERACGCEENQKGWKDRFKSICTLLGYLVCRRKENVNYLCLLIEESMTENNGGTGKSLIMKSVGEWRTKRIKDMKNYDSGAKRFFWAGIADARPDFVIFDDLSKDINMQDFYTLITGDLSYEQKGKDEKIMKYEDMPKLVGATNYFPKGTGNSNDRRLRFFEISNHYNGACTPYGEFGHNLFIDWDDDEWHRFDTFFSKCVVAYLGNGLVQYIGENSVVKKLDANLGELVDFFSEEVSFLPCWFIAKDLAEKANEELRPKVRYTSKGIKSKLRIYCDIMGYDFFDNDGRTIKHNGRSSRWIRVSERETEAVTGGGGSVTENSGLSPSNAGTGDGEHGNVTLRHLNVTKVNATKTETCVSGDEVTDKPFLSLENEKNNKEEGENPSAEPDFSKHSDKCEITSPTPPSVTPTEEDDGCPF